MVGGDLNVLFAENLKISTKNTQTNEILSYNNCFSIDYRCFEFSKNCSMSIEKREKRREEHLKNSKNRITNVGNINEIAIALEKYQKLL